MTAATALPPAHDEPSQKAPALAPAIVGGFRAAIDAAFLHVGATAPNPPVGCAILDADGRVLVTAAHTRAGEPHAEALALRCLAEQGLAARAATLLVTLEPCNHQGRTGPCTEVILGSFVHTVWIGSTDPNPRVAGHGAQRLRDAGVAVHRLDQHPAPEAAVLGTDCRALIAPFRRWAETGRPWVTVKQARNASGSMIPPAGATTFTSGASLHLAHRLRRCTDAVVTGTGTILADAPALTVRHLPDHPGRRRLLVVLGRPDRLPPAYRAAATARGFDLRQIDSLDRLLPELGEAGVLWAMIEAGPRLLRSLCKAGLWDDWLGIACTARPDADDVLSITLAAGLDVSPLSLLPELRQLVPDRAPAWPGGSLPIAIEPEQTCLTQ